MFHIRVVRAGGGGGGGGRGMGISGAIIPHFLKRLYYHEK